MPADSVAVFRFWFGALVAIGAVRFLARGWVGSLHLAPEHHLTYRWFGWVEPLPAPWMHLVVAAVAVLGVCVALGWHHRASTAALIVAFGYVELIEAALYLNHYWFVTLVSVSLLVLPVDRYRSLDARAGRVEASPVVPVAVLWVLRAQLGAVYVFAGLAKLNPDWLLHAQPLRLWLADRSAVWLIGPLLDEPWLALGASWAGALFDCTIVAWLLWRRSRPYAWAALVVFHLVTGALFQIGVFPWLMIVGTTIFFGPDWPTRVGLTGRSDLAGPIPTIGRGRRLFLVAFCAAQALVPLRHLLADGNVRWTEEGYYLSWRVMLTDKAGHVEYRITDPTSGATWLAEPAEVLTDWQLSHAATRPDLLHATALLLAAEHDPDGTLGLEVRADAWVSMNGGPAGRIVDPDLDLAAHRRGELPDGWILDRPTPPPDSAPR